MDSIQHKLNLVEELNWKLTGLIRFGAIPPSGVWNRTSHDIVMRMEFFFLFVFAHVHNYFAHVHTYFHLGE